MGGVFIYVTIGKTESIGVRVRATRADKKYSPAQYLS